MNSFVVFLQIQQGYLLTVQASSYHIHEIPVGNVKFSLFYETQGVLFPSEMNRNKKDVCEVQEREMEEGTSGRNMQTAFMKITFEWLFSVTSSSKTNAQQECPYSGNIPWPLSEVFNMSRPYLWAHIHVLVYMVVSYSPVFSDQPHHRDKTSGLSAFFF